jgi:hypothetical protein
MLAVLLLAAVAAYLGFRCLEAPDVVERLKWAAWLVVPAALMLLPLVPSRMVVTEDDRLAELGLGPWSLDGVWVAGAVGLAVSLGLLRVAAIRHRHLEAQGRLVRRGLPSTEWLWPAWAVALLWTALSVVAVFAGGILMVWSTETMGESLGFVDPYDDAAVAGADAATVQASDLLLQYYTLVLLVLVLNLMFGPMVAYGVQWSRLRGARRRYEQRVEAFTGLMTRLFPDEAARAAAYDRAFEDPGAGAARKPTALPQL